MEYVTLNNGIKMPLIGLGTYPLKGDELKSIIKFTYSIGYRLFDTAWLYGNEADIGFLIKNEEIDREELFLTSKLHIDNLYIYYINRLNLGLRKQTVKEAYESSCKKLGVSRLDLFLLHAPFKNYISMWHDLVKLYHENKVNTIGVSNFTVKDLKNLKDNSDIIPSINQIEVSPYNSNRELINYCKDNGIVIEAFSPFGRGLITKEIMNDIMLNSLSKKYNKSVAQVILRWLTQQKIISIPRSNKINKLEENIDVFDFYLTDYEIDEIYSINKNIQTVGGKIQIKHD